MRSYYGRVPDCLRVEGYVCILRQSGGSTLATDHLLELRAPISGGGEVSRATGLRLRGQTECRAYNEKRSL